MYFWTLQMGWNNKKYIHWHDFCHENFFSGDLFRAAPHWLMIVLNRDVLFHCDKCAVNFQIPGSSVSPLFSVSGQRARSQTFGGRKRVHFRRSDAGKAGAERVDPAAARKVLTFRWMCEITFFLLRRRWRRLNKLERLSLENLSSLV